MRKGPDITEEQDEILDWLDDGFSRTGNIVLSRRAERYKHLEVFIAVQDGFLAAPLITDDTPEKALRLSTEALKTLLAQATERTVLRNDLPGLTLWQRKWWRRVITALFLSVICIAGFAAEPLAKTVEATALPLPEWASANLQWLTFGVLTIVMVGLFFLLLGIVEEMLNEQAHHHDTRVTREELLSGFAIERELTPGQRSRIEGALKTRSERFAAFDAKLDRPLKAEKNGLKPSKLGSRRYRRVCGPLSPRVRRLCQPPIGSHLARKKDPFIPYYWPMIFAMFAVIVAMAVHGLFQGERFASLSAWASGTVGMIPAVVVGFAVFSASRSIQRRRKAKIAARNARLTEAANLVLNGESPVGHRFGPSLRWLERMRAFV